MQEKIPGLILCAALIIVSLNDWDWWWKMPRLKIVTWICRGKAGARVIYIALGLIGIYAILT